MTEQVETLHIINNYYEVLAVSVRCLHLIAPF